MFTKPSAAALQDQSGIGREGGVHGLELYTELKNICIKL
jgi:acyl-CoA reductase-like NAD-dependent aldehyde dehydrogenase